MLDSGNSTSAVINGAGITIEGGSGDDATFTYNTTGPQFELKLGSSFEDLQTAKLTATELDISGDADIDGTLEADAITVNGTALNTVIAGVTVTNATNAAHVTVADNENTNEENLITFIEDTSATGNVGLESDGDFTYNPSTGTVTATIFKGNIDAVDGDFDGTLETDALSIAGTTITSTAAELNIMDGGTAASSTTLVDADRVVTNDNGTMKQVALTDVKTYLSSAGFTTDDPTALAIALG